MKERKVISSPLLLPLFPETCVLGGDGKMWIYLKNIYEAKLKGFGVLLNVGMKKREDMDEFQVSWKTKIENGWEKAPLEESRAGKA